MALFKNKYRIESARLQTWDYGNDAAYFITICTKERIHYFGNIVKDEMLLNEMGHIAYNFGTEIPMQFPFITLDAFVVMPNHVHGILILNKNNDDNNINNNEIANVETRLIETLPPLGQEQSFHNGGGFSGDKNPMLHENISRVVRWYKGRCSFEIRKIHIGFSWQSRFHDHIIRDIKSFETIQNYILTNPENWRDDTFNINRSE